MRVGYLHLPRFPVQRRVLEQPSLKARPVVLFADERGVQRVRFSSGVALERGVRPGMTVAAAAAVLGDVVRRPFDPAAEVKALTSLGEALLVLAPGFQVDGPEGLWLDASAAALCGGEARWAHRVLEAAKRLGLVGRCVVGSERFTTQALARLGPEVALVAEPKGGGALATLPLTALEQGWLGPDAVSPLRALGISTLGEVAALASGALVARFGALGRAAARLSRGDDDSRFVADAPPEVLEEVIELDWPAEHLEPLLFAVKMVVDRLCARLQGRQQAAVRLEVTLGLASGATMAVPLVLARPSSQSKLLLELVRHRMTDLTVEQPIGTVAVRVDEHCAEPGRQLMLGDAPAGEAELEVVLSRLQSALGPESLFAAEPSARHRPEEGWVSTAFHPPDSGKISDLWGVLEQEWTLGQGTAAPVVEEAELPLPLELAEVSASPTVNLLSGYEGSDLPRPPKKRTKAKVEARAELSLTTLGTRPPRLFREPTLLHTQLGQGGGLEAVNLLGRRRRVESMWGPERLAGDWWTEEPFARDYFRVQLEGVGMLWVYRDGRDGQFYAQGIFD